MLRKRARSHPKDQNQSGTMTIPSSISDSYFQSDVSTHNHKSASILKVPGLLVGFNPGSSEFDAVRSPTSTLDYRIFSGFGNPFRLTRVSHNEGHSKPWGCAKVGLSIVDSLDDETKESGKVTRSFHDSKNIIFGRPMSVKSPIDFMETPKSLPANFPVFPNAKPVAVRGGSHDVVFEIGEGVDRPENFHSHSLDSGSSGSRLANFGSKRSLGMEGEIGTLPPSTLVGTSFIGSIPTSEIKLSEDYTCVRIHGPNPKVTHIFGDRILECRNDEIVLNNQDDWPANVDVVDPCLYPGNDFLKFCCSCHKKLDGEDIYMYRGERAFCSHGCRLQEIEMDEEMEKTKKRNSPEINNGPSCGDANGGSSLFIAT